MHRTFPTNSSSLLGNCTLPGLGTDIMFSVPGWNLSARLATQVEKPKAQDPTKEGKKAKKRKQKQQEINDGNVGEYWDKIVGGAGLKEAESRAAEPNLVQQVEVAKDGVQPADEGAQEKRGKKRKRKTNKDVLEGDGASKNPPVEAEADDAQPGAEASVADGVKPTSAESKRDKKKHKAERKEVQSSTSEAAGPPVPLLPPEPKGLTPLQKSMRQKLTGARFRHLNETLYTKPSADSLALFKEDPSMFEDYHRGFAMQTEGWPENPVDGYVSTIITRGKVRPPKSHKYKQRQDARGRPSDAAPVPDKNGPRPLPRNIKGQCTIADLGCGTASLSYRLKSQMKPLSLTLLSYDLCKPSGPSANFVTVADISALPTPDASVDIAIFCLALMGTNWLSFIDEAYRILRWRGELWIAEIKSRFGRVSSSKSKKPPINSIGSLRKGFHAKPGAAKKQEERQEEEKELDSDDEAELATHIDGAPAQEGTDVSAFVDVLRARGFVLDAPPERPSAAIDASNKMFVKLHFVKAAQPTKGKNAKPASGGQPSLRMGMNGKKFTAVANDADDDEQSAKVLKPCLYKIR